MKNDLLVDLAGESLILLPEKAIFWKSKKSLILSDIHFGKAIHFRKSGLQVPVLVEGENFDKLAAILEKTKPAEVYFLGDLFHSKTNKIVPLVADFLKKYKKVAFHLIMGNHDVLSAEEYASMGLVVHPNQLCIPPFVFTHDTEIEDDNFFTIQGHIHPAVMLKGKGRQKISLPCFVWDQRKMVLPAFGAFTGKAIFPIKKDHKVAAIVEESLVLL